MLLRLSRAISILSTRRVTVPRRRSGHLICRSSGCLTGSTLQKPVDAPDVTGTLHSRIVPCMCWNMAFVIAYKVSTDGNMGAAVCSPLRVCPGISRASADPAAMVYISLPRNGLMEVMCNILWLVFVTIKIFLIVESCLNPVSVQE